MGIQRRTFLTLLSSTSLVPLAAAGAAPDIPLPQGRVSAVLDTDTFNEIDDQFAVAYAMLSPDRIALEAIYAAPFQNTRAETAGEGMTKSYEEIVRVLGRLGSDRQNDVFKGSQRFMGDKGRPVESPAAADLIQRAQAKRETPLYVVAVGAPTNVASALLIEPSIREKIVVVWLGGQPYHFPSADEFNLKQDPAASRVLYDSGVRLLNVPTRNVSEQLRLTIPEAERFMKGRSSISDYLLEIFIDFYKELDWSRDEPRSKVIWDIAAVAWLIEPSWISSQLVPSPILTQDLTWQTDSRRHSVRVATHVNRDAIFADLFRKLASVPRQGE